MNTMSFNFMSGLKILPIASAKKGKFTNLFAGVSGENRFIYG